MNCFYKVIGQRPRAWSVVALLWFAITLSGCPEPPKVIPPGLPDKVELSAPADKAVFNAEADLDKNAPGVQINVEIKIGADSTGKLPDGLKARILVNNKPVKEVSVTEASLKFEGVTLEEGFNSIQAQLEFDGKTQNSNAIQVTADSKCYAIQFAKPRNKKVFGTNDDADPQKEGFQTDIEIQVDATAQEEMELEIKDESGQVVSTLKAKPFNGKVTFTKEEVTLPPGKLTLTARITDSAGNKCSDSIEVDVQTKGPSVTIAAPKSSQLLCPNDDADSTSLGYQVKVEARTAASDGSSATLWLNGKKEGEETTVANGAMNFQFTLPDVFEVSSEVQVRVKDNLGNLGASTTVKFDSVLRGYSLAFRDLIDGQTIPAGRDTDPNTPGIQLKVPLITSAKDGTNVSLKLNDSAPVTGVVTGGVATITVTLKEGQNCLEASIEEPKCKTKSTSKTCVRLEPVGLPSLDCSLEKGPAFVQGLANLNASHDTDKQKPGIQNGIKCRSDAEVDQNVEFTLNGNSQIQKLAKGPGQLQEVSFSGLELQEGVNTLTIKVSNKAGKSRTLNLKANVDTTAPDAVVDLKATVKEYRKASITLSFTTPKDGSGGTSSIGSYEVRYSSLLENIEENKWDKPEGKLNLSATPGSGQQTSLTVDNLSVGKTYIFAVRAKDLSSNLSKISNVFKLSIDLKSSSGNENGTTSTNFGYKLTYVGDLDKDGRADVVACSLLYTAQGRANAGAALVYYGRDISTGSFFGTSPDAIIAGTIASDGFCQSVAPLGDLNGDGYADFAVGSNADSRKGRVYIFFGGARGTSIKNGTADSLARVILTGQSGTFFGLVAASVGAFGAPDLNGDKKADLLVAAPLKVNGTFKGSVYVYLSRASYPQPGKPALVIPVTGADYEIVNDFVPSVKNQSFFGLVMSAGDINNDKNSDLLIAARSSNVVVGLLGPIKPTAGKQLLLSKFSSKFQIRGNATENGFFGSAIAFAGDVNKDGTNDILVGSLRSQVGSIKQAGKVRLFSGKALTAGATVKDTAAVVTYNGRGAFLNTVSAAGDVNGDGFDDFLMGEGKASDSKTPATAEGAAYLIYGRAFSAFKNGEPSKLADVTWYGSQSNAGLGWYGLIGGFDLTGDGFVDILMAETPPPKFKLSGKIYLKY